MNTIRAAAEVAVPWSLPLAAVSAADDFLLLKEGWPWLAIGAVAGVLRVLFLYTRPKRPAFPLVAFTVAAAPGVGFLCGLVATHYAFGSVARIIAVICGGFLAEIILNALDAIASTVREKPLEALRTGKLRRLLELLAGEKDKEDKGP